MSFIVAFIWGGFGGLLVELVDYSIKFKQGDFENEDNTFRKYYLIPCIISSFTGAIFTGALGAASTPSEIWFLVVGIGASSFVAKFSLRH